MVYNLWLYLKQLKILNILVNIKDIFFQLYRVWILVLDRIQKTANCTSQTEKAVGTSWSFMFYVTNQLFTIECAVLYYHFMANWKQSYSLDSAEGKVNCFLLIGWEVWKTYRKMLKVVIGGLLHCQDSTLVVIECWYWAYNFDQLLFIFWASHILHCLHN